VQAESFFDPGRLDAALGPQLIPEFAAIQAQALERGRFEVAAWGANTTRTEFAVLSGHPLEALGFDRYNPYHAFARRRVGTFVWDLKQLDYRTICIHPHDPRFYNRAQVLPRLGFDEFYSEKHFSLVERTGRYLPDLAAGELGAQLIRQSARPIFIFIITMENHGPWVDGPDDLLPAVLARRPSAAGLARYLAGLTSSDRMLGPLVSALHAHGDGVLALYGDHMPSLALGRSLEPATDYLIWRPGFSGSPAERACAAHELCERVLAACGLT
jgi:phosphoglycerol transferase MdoB-like AlkP superfamily enzyme